MNKSQLRQIVKECVHDVLKEDWMHRTGAKYKVDDTVSFLSSRDNKEHEGIIIKVKDKLHQSDYEYDIEDTGANYYPNVKEKSIIKQLNSPLEEMFGISKKEKSLKKLNEIYELAKKEINKYNFDRIFGQPSENPTNQQYRQIVNSRVQDFIEAAPNFVKLCPKFTVYADASDTNAANARYKNISGVVPAQFSSSLKNGEVIDDFVKKTILSELDYQYKRIQQKLDVDKDTHEVDDMLKEVSPSDLVKKEFPEVLNYDRQTVRSDINWKILTSKKMDKNRIGLFQAAVGYDPNGYGGPFRIQEVPQSDGKFQYSWTSWASSN